MSIADYLDLFREFGVDVDWVTERREVNGGRALRMIGGALVPGSIYFNSNKHGVIHFTVNDRPSISEIDWNLWAALPDSEIKSTDHGKPNIHPIEGSERQALRQLLMSAGVL